MKKDSFSLLANLQTGSSSLKSLAAMMALEGLERHDSIHRSYSNGLFTGLDNKFSDLDKFYQEYLSNFHFENENNYVVTQETAQYLLKTFRSVVAGNNNNQLSEHELTIAYMTQYLQNPKATCSISSAAALLNPQVIMNAFGFRAAYLVAQVSKDLEDRHGYTWKNTVMTDINRMFKAHCQYMIIRRLFTTGSGSSLWQRHQNQQHTTTTSSTGGTTTTTTTTTHSSNSCSNSSSSIIVEQKLQQQEAFAYLFALHTMETEMSDFILSGYISAVQAKMVKDQVVELTARIQSDIVGPLMDVLVLSTGRQENTSHLILEEDEEDAFLQYYRRYLASSPSAYWSRYYNKGNDYERGILAMIERAELNHYYRALAALGRHGRFGRDLLGRRNSRWFMDDQDERRNTSAYQEIVELAERVALRDFYLALALNRFDGKTYERMIGFLPSTSSLIGRKSFFDHDHPPFVVDNYENFVKLFVHNALQKRRWLSKL
ncbi:hypothetical protein BDA99DRAFT_561643 [Phascolomyces articulosus]|uniref:Acyl-CoA oxidase C-terminal domain-containing protein n=1 Tax=Phascolomyces articulosus TaxID=60185 RepID=A0AAD5K5E9_9FUNG|nr:hypothetical protein BDA99DRAFT_561643 [Phascolomyces articulosus]